MATRRRTSPPPDLDSSIALIRGQRVILSGDLSIVYGVSTKALNQAVRRNADRFPPDFVFTLTLPEARQVARLRSQSVTLDARSPETPEIARPQTVSSGRGGYSKFAPLAFTEHGAVMVAAVLKSPRAVDMSIFVVRAFLQLRQMVAGQADLAAELAKLERRVTTHDHELKSIVVALRRLMEPQVEPPRRRIGFVPDPRATNRH